MMQVKIAVHIRTIASLSCNQTYGLRSQTSKILSVPKYTHLLTFGTTVFPYCSTLKKASKFRV